MRHFFELAAARIRHRRDEWQTIITQGALAEAQNTLNNLDALNNNQLDFLTNARHFAIQPGEFAAPGFCGHLNRYFDPATLMPEGITKR